MAFLGRLAKLEGNEGGGWRWCWAGLGEWRNGLVVETEMDRFLSTTRLRSTTEKDAMRGGEVGLEDGFLRRGGSGEAGVDEVESMRKAKRRGGLAKLGNMVVIFCAVISTVMVYYSLKHTNRKVPETLRLVEPMFEKTTMLREHIYSRFDVPIALLQAMEAEQLNDLLKRLVAKEEDYELPDRPTVVFVHCVRDFESRVNAIVNALSYAINTKRVLVVFWQEDSVLRRRYTELFEDDSRFIVSTVNRHLFPSGPNLRLNEDFSLINTIIVQGNSTLYNHTPAPKEVPGLPYDYDKHVYVKDSVSFKSPYAPHGHTRRLLRTLKEKPLAASAMKQMRAGEYYGQLSRQEITTALHGQYSIPYDFLVGMSEMDQSLLLDQLVRLKEFVQEPRCLLIHVQFGLGNRLRALSSAMAFADKTHRALIVIWERDYHFDAGFHHLFVNDLISVEKLHAEWPFRKDRDDAYKGTILYNHMSKDGKGTIKAGSHHLDNTLGKNIYLKTAYIVKSQYSGTDNPRKHSVANDYMRSIVPTIEIRKEVDRIRMHNLKQMVGVHIRSRSVETEMQNVDAKAEYTQEGKERVEFWRRTTQLHVFVEEMHKREQKEHGKKLRFYVAADDTNIFKELDKLFPNRIYYVPRRCDDRSPECVRYAFIDILCLAETNYILGSFWSSFSEAAVRIGGNKIYLAGVDFHHVKQPK